MKEKRMLQLINDERTLRSVRKAAACSEGANDGGCLKQDLASCANYAADAYCVIDLGACTGNETRDYCQSETDYRGCDVNQDA